LLVLTQFHEAQRTASEAYGELCMKKSFHFYISLFYMSSNFIIK